MSKKVNNIPGIKRVELPKTTNLFTSYGNTGVKSQKQMNKSNEKSKGFNKSTKEILSKLELNNKKAQEIVSYGQGMGATKRASEKARSGSPMVIFGMKESGQTESGVPAISEFSFSKFKNLEEMKDKEFEVHNILFKQPENVTKDLLKTVDNLESDPLSYYKLDETTQESLASLIGLSDSSLFGQEMEYNGKKYKTAPQREKTLRASQSILTNKGNTKKMRQAIENLSNDELTTPSEELGGLIDSLTEDSPVFVGHNAERGSQLTLEKHLRGTGSPEERINRIKSPMIDTFQLSKSATNKRGKLKSQDYDLDTLYSSITHKPFGELGNETAADDVRKTIALTSQLSNSNYVSRNNQKEVVYPKDKFQVRKGIGYSPNDLDNNEAQYDLVTVKDPDTGKFKIQQGGGRRGTGRSASTFEYVGGIDPMEIDGVEHQGITLHNQDQDTYHHFFRTSESGIDDLFNNHLVKAGEMKEDEMNYIKQDRARRRYLDMFSEKATSESDSSVGKLKVAYSIIDEHEEVLKELGKDTDLSEMEILKLTQERVNKNKHKNNKSQAYGLSRIEDTIYLKDKLSGERDMWAHAGKEAQFHAGASSDEKTRIKRENIYMNDFFQSLVDKSEPGEYGYEGMEMLKLKPISSSEEVAYRNVGTADNVRSFVQEEINKDIERTGKGKDNAHTQRIFNMLGNDLPENQREEITNNLNLDLKRGEVRPKTVDDIANAFNRRKLSLKENGNIVNRVDGLDTEKVLSLSLLGDDYSSPGEFKEELRSEVDRRVARNSGVINNVLNGEEASRIVKASESKKEIIRKGVVESNSLITGTSSTVDIFTPKTAQEQIQKTVQRFESDGFQVRLEKSDGSDRLSLFATPNQDMDISALSYEELESSKGIFGAVIPLFNEDFSVDTKEGGVRDTGKLVLKGRGKDGFDINNLTPADVEVKGTADFLFDEISKSSILIKNAMDKGYTEEEAIAQSMGRVSKQSTELGISAGFRGFNSREFGYKGTSREKNRNPLLDMSSYQEEYARVHNPRVHARFEKGRNEGGPQNILSYFYEPGESIAFELGTTALYEEQIGKATGVSLHAEGRNVNQSGSGLYNMLTPLNLSPTPQLNDAHREQSTKVPNYELMNRKELEDYFGETVGKDSLSAKLSTEPAQNRFANMPGREKESRAFEVRSLRMGDEELAKHSPAVVSKLKKQKDKINSKPGELTTEDREKVNQINRRINLVESGIFSTDEDEYLMSEELASSVFTQEHMEIELGSYEIDPTLENYFKDEFSIEEGVPLGKGRHMIDGGLDYKELERMGLIDEKGMLTVGGLVEEQTIDNEGIEFGETKRKRLQKAAYLEGIEIDSEGNSKLLINNQYQGSSGIKSIRTDTGARETAKVAPQDLIQMYADELGVDKRVEVIQAFEKAGVGGRGSTAGLYSDITRTAARSVSDAIDDIYADGESSVSAVNEFFKEGTSGDKVEDYQRYMEEVFVPEITETVGKNYIEVYKENAQGFQFGAMTVPGTSKEKQDALTNLHDLAVDKYGMVMEDTFAETVTPLSLHNVDRWTGIGSNAKFGRVELGMLDQLVKGPTELELEEIRAKGVIDGVDYSNYDYKTKIPGESIIAEKFRQQSREGNLGTGEDRREQKEYAQKVKSSIDSLKGGIIEEDIQGQGNIIIDAAGEYTFDKDSNFLTMGEGEDAFTVVDGSSIKVTPKGMPSGAERRGTYSNLNSVGLYSDDVETTIGDMVEEQNSTLFVKMMDENNPIAVDAQLSNNIVEAIPMLSGDKLGDSYLTSVEAAQTKAFESAHTLAYEAPRDGMDAEGWMSGNLRNLKSGLSDLETEGGKFLGGQSTKDHALIQKENSLSFTMSSRNILNTKYREQDVVMGTDQARTLIGGRTRTILDANEVSDDSIRTFSELSEEEFSGLKGMDREKLEEDYILDRISGAKKDGDEFEAYFTANRNPTQNEGSITFGSIRVDETGEYTGYTANIDPRLAARMGGDFDGDTGYLSTYNYLEDETSQGAVASQKELKDLTEMTTAMAMKDHHQGTIDRMSEEGQNVYKAVMDIPEGNDLDTVFEEKINRMSTVLSITSDKAMQSGVGKTYNTVNVVRDAVGVTTDGGMLANANPENVSQLRALQSDSTGLMEKIQENAISKKKMRLEEIAKFAGFSPEQSTKEDLERMQEEGNLEKYAIELGAAREKLPGRIENITEQSAPQLIDDMMAMSILDYSDDEDGQSERMRDVQTMQGVGRASDAWANSAYGAFNSQSLKRELSSSNEDKQQVISQMIERPESVPMTEKNISAAEMFLTSEQNKTWVDKSTGTADNVEGTFNRLTERANKPKEGFEASSNLINQIAKSTMEEGSSGDTITSQSSAFRTMTEGASGLMKSNVFKAAAGVSAAWMFTRAIGKGPTPEGNDAEREQATPQEIAPSQLLTSPTARVTPGAEAVSLDISGEGNLSQEEAAGLINNEVQSMTQMNMNMNVNVSDNTAKLDNRFYQSQVDKVFGV